MAISGDLVLQGLAGELGQQLDRRAEAAEIRARQKAAFEEILFREKLRRETDEINRRAKLGAENTKADRAERVSKRTKQRLEQANLVVALGGADNLSTAFGREPARGLQRVVSDVDISPLRVRNNFGLRADLRSDRARLQEVGGTGVLGGRPGLLNRGIDERTLGRPRVNIRQQPQISESLRPLVENVQLGTPSQLLLGVDRFRRTEGRDIIPPPKVTGRESEASKRHKEQIRFYDNDLKSVLAKKKALNLNFELSTKDIRKERKRLDEKEKFIRGKRLDLLKGGTEFFIRKDFQHIPTEEEPVEKPKFSPLLKDIQQRVFKKRKNTRLKIGRFEIIEQ